MPLETVTNTFGTFTFLDNEEYIGRILKTGVPWEENLVSFVLKFADPARVAIDVGAHIGTHSIPYASAFKHVYSFEAQSHIYQLLVKNIKDNNITNITAFNLAAGHTLGTAHISKVIPDGCARGNVLTYDSSTDVNYGGVQLGKGGEEVTMVTIDQLCSCGWAPFDVGYIKVDAEGSEPLVFYGARETITRCRPLILYERNFKRITQDMIDDMNLPAEVYNFSIEEFCSKLRYMDPVRIDGNDNYVLFPLND
jgi:FkbM family methyltransferase